MTLECGAPAPRLLPVLTDALLIGSAGILPAFFSYEPRARVLGILSC
jgi:hypothetical protein